ncbi:MAG TPA: DUF1223 domain-containing protein [Terriglobales bacterium]
MKFIWLRAVLVLSAMAVPLALPRAIETGTGAPAPARARKTVVVELFTSEGCSSCPPADALLGRLDQEKFVDGLEIIPLGLHVDYWNFQGWTDRFSSADYTLRQQKYAERFGIEGPYTPQMVVDGDQQFVGSDLARARQAITQAAVLEQPAAIEISPQAAGKIEVQIKGPRSAAGDVLVAISEDNLSSKVHGGENNGRELRHWAVVRRLQPVGRLRQGIFAATVPVKLEKEWKAEDLHVVVFVQQPESGRIIGAARIPATSLFGAR